MKPVRRSCARRGATHPTCAAAAGGGQCAAVRRARPRLRQEQSWFDPAPSLSTAGGSCATIRACGCYRKSAERSGFLEPIADAVERLDHVEIVVGDLELLAQPFDVAV